MVGTQGILLAGAGAGFWSEDCRAALIACGINPDACGPYSEVSDAISKERAAYRQKRIEDAEASPGRDHESNCPLTARKPASKPSDCFCWQGTSQAVADDMGVDGWLLANSEAGHVQPDNLVRDGTGSITGFGGKRGDVCSNIVPGYLPNDSFTILHHGKACGAGIHGEHNAVRRVEMGYEAELRDEHRGTNGRVTTEQRNEATRRNADLSAQYTGQGPRRPGEFDSEIAAANDPNNAHLRDVTRVTDERREQLTRDMRDEAGKQTDGSLAAKIDAAMVDPPDDVSPTDEAIAKAAECLEAKAKQNLQDMQKEVMDNHSTVSQSQACQDACAAHGVDKFSELPPDVRQQVLRDSRAEVRQRNDEIVAQEAADPHGSQDRHSRERQADCLERQGNILANDFRNDGTFTDHWGGQVSGT